MEFIKRSLIVSLFLSTTFAIIGASAKPTPEAPVAPSRTDAPENRLIVEEKATAAIPRGDRNFVYCIEANPTTFSPQVAYDTSTFTVVRGIFNRLVDFEQGSTKVIPSIAKSWSMSGAGRAITFTLRKDVFFHSTGDFSPTRPLNADDVIYTFERMRNQAHPLHKLGGGNYQYYQALEMDKIIKNIVKVYT